MAQLLLTNETVADVRPLLRHEKAEQLTDLSCVCSNPKLELIHDTAPLLQSIYWDQVFQQYPFRGVTGFYFDHAAFAKPDPCYIRCTNCGRRYTTEWFSEEAIAEWKTALNDGILSSGYAYSIWPTRVRNKPQPIYNYMTVTGQTYADLWNEATSPAPPPDPATVMLETYTALGKMGATEFQGLHAAAIGAERLGWPEDKTVKVQKLFEDPVKQSIVERFARFFGLSKRSTQ